MMLRHVLNGLAKRTQHFFQRNISINVYVPQAPGAQQMDLVRMP